MAGLARTRTGVWLLGPVGLLLLSACFGPFGSDDSHLSETEAVAAARQGAGYITPDEPILDTTVERTTYSEGASGLGGGGGETRGEAPVWKVVFKGMFYEPEGPPPDPGSPRPPRKPVCGQVTVLIDDATAQDLLLSFGRSSGC